MFSKYERRIDTRTYGDKKELFDGVSFHKWIFRMFSVIFCIGMTDPTEILLNNLNL